MDQIEEIIDILENVKLSNDLGNDDELLQLETEIILHWERLTCEIGFRSEATDGFCFEVIPIQMNKRKDSFVRDLISALTKFAIMNLCMLIKLSEFRQKYLFQTASCATLLDKVQELSGINRRELFKVTFNHEGCEVKLLFFIATHVGCENMLFTAGYYNPEATDELVMKLLNSANDYPFLDTVGFIGILSGDRCATLRHCVQIAHQTVVKHAALMKQQKDEARQIENWHFTESKELDDRLFNTQSKEISEESATKHRRNLRSGHKQEFVDLTVASSEVEKIKDTMLLSDDSFHSLACSDILGSTGPPLGDFHDGLSEGFKDGWDDNTLALKPIFDQFFLDKMESWLKHGDEPGETVWEMEEEMRDETSHMNRTVPITPRAPHKSSAQNFYQEKAERDYSDSVDTRPSIHRKTPATLPDTRSRNKHPHRMNPDIGLHNVPIKRSRLLDAEEYETEQNSKEKRFAASYKIPKVKKPSPDRQRSSSTTWKPPPNVTRRSPIRPPVGACYTEQASHGDDRAAFYAKIIVSNAATTPYNASSPNRYEQDCSPRSEARSSRNSDDIGSNVQRGEVIILDEDDDQVELVVKDENNDTNNNKHQKRLYPLSESEKPNKIFITKPGRKKPKPVPNFSPQIHR